MPDQGATESAGSSLGWNSVDEALFAWLDLPPAQAEEHLAQLRAQNPVLAAAVAARFELLRGAGLRPGLPGFPGGPQPGTTFGDYRILHPLGAGGMGTVYLAEQTALRRRVALKVIQPGRLANPAARERFRREARAVANLRHPGICGVLDVGEVDGTPFLAMQHVEGETLAARLAAARRGDAEAAGAATRAPSTGPTTQREIHATLELIEQVARALHVAHESGVVHRDVKPGNIMIDRDGGPVLLDFGLARESATADASLTVTGEMLGTPAYMSPEQVRRRGRDIDRRTDVYSLGVTLFECLTLERPFAASSQVTLFERIERDPTPDPRRSHPRLPSDLTAVVAKAMEKEPAQRYATALELAEELQRVRRNEPVRARRIGPVRRLWRWTRRNPVAAGLVLASSLGSASISILLQQTSAQRDAIAGISEARRVQALVGAAATELRTDPTLSLLLATKAYEASATPETVEQLRASLGAAFERHVLRGHGHYVNRSLLSRDGARTVTGSEDGTVRVWDLEGSERRCFDLGAPVRDLDLLDDGAEVLCATADGAARALDLATGGTRELARERGSLYAARALARGRIASAGDEGVLRIRATDGTLLREFPHGEPIWVVAAGHRHPQLVATADFRGVVRLFDIGREQDAQRFARGSASTVDRVVFSPTHDELLVADRAGNATLLDFDGNVVASCVHGSPGAPVRVYDAVIAPDGERFLTVGSDARGCVWWRDGRLSTVLAGHAGEVYSCAVSPSGSWWATAAEDGTVRLWTERGNAFAVLRGHTSAIYGGLSFAPDERLLLSAGSDTTARLWDLTLEGLPVLQSPAGAMTTARFLSQRREIVATTVDGHVIVWSRSGERLADLRLPHATLVASAALDTAGQRLVLGQAGGPVHVIDLARRAIVASLPPGDPSFRLVDVHPGSDRVLVVSTGWQGFPPTLALTGLDLDQPRRIASLDAGTMVHAACFAPDGERIWLGCGDGSIRAFSLAGEPVAAIDGHSGAGILGIGFSPDGRLFGSASIDRTARLWDVGPKGDLRDRCVLRGHENDVMRVRFAPDNQRVVTASRDGAVRVWTRDGELVTRIRGHEGIVYDAWFESDAAVILTCGSEGTARLWHADASAVHRAASARKHRDFDVEELARHGHLLERTAGR